MNSPPELEQQLWELIYELLPEEEAGRLRARISSEPDVARAYAKAKLQADRLALAARVDEPSIELRSPEVATLSAATAVASAPRWTLRRYRAWTRVAAGLAAALLVGFIGSALLYMSPRPSPATRSLDSLPDPQLIAVQTINTSLTTPAYFHREIENPVVVQLTDEAGSPVATEVEYRIYDERGDLRLQQLDMTDRTGVSQVHFSGKNLPRVARVEVVPAGTSSERPPAASVAVFADQTRTFVTTDKSLYRPGEAVRFRSVSLSRFDLRVEREFDLQYSVADLDGRIVPGSTQSVETRQGVGSGQFLLPPELAGGEYQVVVSASETSFPAQQRRFHVRDYVLPRWSKNLELHQDNYTPGDDVVVDFTAQASDGNPAAGLELQLQAFADGQPVPVESGDAMTDEQGRHRWQFRLPDTMQTSDAVMTVTASDDEYREATAKRIPIHHGEVVVQFFPEGGKLVAGVPGRVYFLAEDALGEPVHIRGRLLDEQGSEIVAVETQHLGRGVFRFLPQAGRTYSLAIDRPAVQEPRPQLPPVGAPSGIVLETGLAAFSADASLPYEVRAARPLGPVVLAAACRGAIVGLARLDPSTFVSQDGAYLAAGGELRVSPDTGGVVRLTAYDYGTATPQPLAERLVYCRPATRLEVEFTSLAEKYAPGEAVDLTIHTNTENGQGVPAALGVSVVPESALALVEAKTPTLPTYFYLASEIKEPQDLEDAEFYVQDSPEAEQALDLLLGTAGWRTFVQPGLDTLAAIEVPPPAEASAMLGAQVAASPAETSLGDEPLMAPQMVSAKLALTSATSKILESPPRGAARSGGPRDAGSLFRWGVAFALVVLWGGLILAAARRYGVSRVYIPVVAVTCGCLLIGFVFMQIARTGSVQVADVASTGSLQLAQEEAPTASDSESGSVENFALRDEQSAEPSSPELLFESGRAPEGEQLEQLLRMEGVSEQNRDAEQQKGRPVEESDEGFELAESLPAQKAQAKSAPEDAASTLGQGLEEPRLNAVPPAPTDSRERQVAEPARESATGEGRLDLPRADRVDELDVDTPAEKAGGGRANMADEVSPQTAPSAAAAGQNRFRRLYAFGDRLSGVASLSLEQTLYWNPQLDTNAEGEAVIRFFAPPQAAAFRLRADAHADGRLGAAQARILVEAE